MVYKTERNELVTSYETEHSCHNTMVATVAILSRVYPLSKRERERERRRKKRFEVVKIQKGKGRRQRPATQRVVKKDGMSLNDGACHGARPLR